MTSPPNHKTSPALLTFLVVVMILTWVFNFIFGKMALRSLDAFTLASFRVELAAVVMVAVYLAMPARWHDEIAGPVTGRYGAGPGRQTSFDRHDFWKFVQLGVLGVAMNQMFFTIGLNYTTVGHAALIVGVGPINTLWMARLFGLEHITPRKLGGMLLAFTGVAVLVLPSLREGLGPAVGAQRTWVGDLITLTGSLAFSLYTVLGKRVAARYDSVAMNLYNYSIAAVLVLPLAVWRGMRLDWAAVGWQGWTGLAYMAVFASVVAYLIFYWALRHMSASRLAAFSYLLPLLATLMGILLLGEKVTKNLLIGGALVLAGVWLAERSPRPDEEIAVAQP